MTAILCYDIYGLDAPIADSGYRSACDEDYTGAFIDDSYNFDIEAFHQEGIKNFDYDELNDSLKWHRQKAQEYLRIEIKRRLAMFGYTRDDLADMTHYEKSTIDSFMSMSESRSKRIGADVEKAIKKALHIPDNVGRL